MNEQLTRRVRKKLDHFWPYQVTDAEIRQAVRAARKYGGRRDGGGMRDEIVNLAVSRLAPMDLVRRPIPSVR